MPKSSEPKDKEKSSSKSIHVEGDVSNAVFIAGDKNKVTSPNPKKRLDQPTIQVRGNVDKVIFGGYTDVINSEGDSIDQKNDQQSQPKSMQKKDGNPWRFVVGLVLFVVFVAVVRWAILFGITRGIFPQFLQDWISKNLESGIASGIAVWCISILTLGGVHFAIQLGAKVKFFGLEISQSIFDNRYVIVFFAAAVLGLLLVAKVSCEESIVYIRVKSGTGFEDIYSGQIYKVQNNIAGSIMLSADAGESELTCEWSFSGTLVKSLLPKTSCSTLAFLSSNEGHSVVSVRSSEKYCPGNFSITSFEVER